MILLLPFHRDEASPAQRGRKSGVRGSNPAILSVVHRGRATPGAHLRQAHWLSSPGMAIVPTNSRVTASRASDTAPGRLHGAGIYAIPPATRFRKHEHDSVHICAVLGGAFRESIATRDTTLVTGSLRVSPAARHQIHFGPNGACCLVVEIRDAEIARVISQSYHRSAVFHDRSLFALARSIGAEVEAFNPTTPLIMECHVAEIAAQIGRRSHCRTARVPPRWLRETRDHLIEAPQHVSLAGLARARDVHVVHSARAFREHFGLTVGNFVRRRRLITAGHLMGDPSLPLSRIAQEAGFADQSHMTREFKRAWRTTPALWRETIVSKGTAR